MWRHWSCLCYCQNKPTADLCGPCGNLVPAMLGTSNLQQSVQFTLVGQWHTQEVWLEIKLGVFATGPWGLGLKLHLLYVLNIKAQSSFLPPLWLVHLHTHHTILKYIYNIQNCKTVNQIFKMLLLRYKCFKCHS